MFFLAEKALCGAELFLEKRGNTNNMSADAFKVGTLLYVYESLGASPQRDMTSRALES
jgi:hypothetical protein